MNKNKENSFKIATPEVQRRIWASIPAPKHKNYATENSAIF
jgi:hypothetical protein